MSHPYNFVEALVLVVMGFLVFYATIQEHRSRAETGVHFTDVLGLVISAGCVSCGIIAGILAFLR